MRSSQLKPLLTLPLPAAERVVQGAAPAQRVQVSAFNPRATHRSQAKPLAEARGEHAAASTGS